LIIDSKQVFHLLIGFRHLSMLSDVMLKHFAFPLRKHLVLNIHEKLGLLIEFQLIRKLLLQVHRSLDVDNRLLLIQKLKNPFLFRDRSDVLLIKFNP